MLQQGPEPTQTESQAAPNPQQTLRTNTLKARQAVQARIFWDIVTIVLVSLGVFLIAHYFNLFDVFVIALGNRDETLFDEFLVMAAFIAVALTIFSFRRWHEGQAEITLRSQAQEALVELSNSLEKQVQARTADLEKTNLSLQNESNERQRANELVQRQLTRLTALSDIDRAITGSFDMRLSLNTVLLHVLGELNVAAASVLIFNPVRQNLTLSVSRGFRIKVPAQLELRIGEGYAGRAALERQTIHIRNLAEQHDNPRLMELLASEKFSTYYALPLIAKGQVKGVLEVFLRETGHDSEVEWLDFLKALAGQAAIAIDNATLFEGMQRSNIELALAYDATIEGWSRALDLRDKETEGHTLRVTDLTLRVAKSAGFSDEDLVHLRRGALLHDIGKMGVPDAILLKPAPLTDEEWIIMRKHPTYARELLYPIAHLRPALDIPYSHHEKWDGSGYPLGLKGEQTPLSARLFALVDVWDALRSDRPYRPAWEPEKVRAHIQSLVGTHFDPEAAKIFLAVV